MGKELAAIVKIKHKRGRLSENLGSWQQRANMDKLWIPRKQVEHEHSAVCRVWAKFKLLGTKEVLYRGFTDKMACIRDGDKELVVIRDKSGEWIYMEVKGETSEEESYSCMSDVSSQTEAGSERGAMSLAQQL